ncbi:MAG: citryl-CoA lyase [Ancalomicrobiaceae bacterium]|nr:citryl-CoA lyase [Ancalomicrobiaceae bacterium]
MLIGKRGEATTAISSASATGITVRGHDLVTELMGRLSFTDYFFLLATGRLPTPDQRDFLDMCLIALAEHGLTPSVQAARMTLAADPAALQAAVAAGVLGCGTVILGAANDCRRLIEAILARVDAGSDLAAEVAAVANAYRSNKAPIPGYGHPLHKPIDPRAERMIGVAEERGVAARGILAARALQTAIMEVWGKPLPMNVSMAIAAVMLDLDVPAIVIRGIPILARTAGLIAHLGEEAEAPIGFYLASVGEEAIRHTQARGQEPAP